MSDRRLPRYAVATIFLYMLAYSLGILALPLQGSVQGLPASAITLLIAVPGLASLAILVPGLAVQHRVSIRVTIVTASALAITAGLALLLRAPIALAAAAVLLGISAALFWPTALTALSVTGQETYQGHGALAQGLAGLGAGIIVAGFGASADIAGWGIVVAASACLLIGTLMRSKPRTSATRFTEEVRDVLHRGGALLRSSGSLVSSLATFPFSVLWWVGGTSFLTLYVISVDLPIAMAGTLVAVRAATATALRVAYAPVARRIGPLGVWISGCLLAGGAMILMPISVAPAWLMACAVVQGIGLSGVLPAANSLAVHSTAPEDRTVGFALPFATAQAAILTMPVVLGAVAGLTDGGWALAAAGLVAVITTLALGAVAKGMRASIVAP